MSIDRLIKRCKRHNLNAQSELYTRYKDVLFTLCLKYCKNKEEAEDNLQDAFISIFNNISKYKGNGSFEGWMKRITINKAIDKYKKESFINIVINDDMLEDIEIDTNELNVPLHILLDTIQELPSRYRLVFNMYEMDNYTHKEIAKSLEISEGTSKSNLHRAKMILKNRIKELNQTQPINAMSNGK